MRTKDKKEINITVGQNIRFYREKAGLNREKLSELIGVSPRFLADCELGFVGISLTTLKKICEVLGVSADKVKIKKKSTFLLDKTYDFTEKKTDIQENSFQN